MITSKVVLSEFFGTEVVKDVKSSLEVFADWKKKEADLKRAKDDADKARQLVTTQLKTFVPELKESQDYEITVEIEGNIYLVSSKASKQTYLSQEDLSNKIAGLAEMFAELNAHSITLANKGSVVKSAPKITFDIKKL